MDIAELITGLEENPETSLQEIVTLIKRHTNDKNRVERDIPTDPFNLGLFPLSCTSVRDKLAAKHEDSSSSPRGNG